MQYIPNPVATMYIMFSTTAKNILNPRLHSESVLILTHPSNGPAPIIENTNQAAHKIAYEIL